MSNNFGIFNNKNQINFFTQVKGGVNTSQLQGTENDKKLSSIFDKNKDGVIDANEIKSAVDANNDGKVSQKELDNFIKGADLGKDGKKAFLSFINNYEQQQRNINQSNIQENADGTKTVTTGYQNGTSESVTKDAYGNITTVTSQNGQTNTVVKRPDGSLAKEIQETPQGTVTTEYAADGTTPTLKSTAANGQIETTNFENGQPTTKTIEDKNTNTKSYYNIQGGQDTLTKTVQNEGTPNQMTTEFTQNSNGTTTAVTTNAQGDPVKTSIKQGDKLLEETTVKDNKETVKIFNPDSDGYTETITDGNSGNVVINTYADNDGKHKLTCTKNIGGQDITASYDGEGNTKVTVQNGETISQIAKNFNITDIKSFVELNKGQVIKSGNSIGFRAGAEIKVPGEVDPSKLQGRKSKDEVISDYKITEAQIKAKQEAEAAANAQQTQQSQQTSADLTGVQEAREFEKINEEIDSAIKQLEYAKVHIDANRQGFYDRAANGMKEYGSLMGIDCSNASSLKGEIDNKIEQLKKLKHDVGVESRTRPDEGVTRQERVDSAKAQFNNITGLDLDKHYETKKEYDDLMGKTLKVGVAYAQEQAFVNEFKDLLLAPTPEFTPGFTQNEQNYPQLYNKLSQMVGGEDKLNEMLQAEGATNPKAFSEQNYKVIYGVVGKMATNLKQQTEKEIGNGMTYEQYQNKLTELSQELNSGQVDQKVNEFISSQKKIAPYMELAGKGSLTVLTAGIGSTGVIATAFKAGAASFTLDSTDSTFKGSFKEDLGQNFYKAAKNAALNFAGGASKDLAGAIGLSTGKTMVLCASAESAAAAGFEWSEKGTVTPEGFIINFASSATGTYLKITDPKGGAQIFKAVGSTFKRGASDVAG